MITDSHFEIGFTHDVCQDYALTSNINGVGCAIISDGCSASHDECGQLDVGSRILSYCALSVVKNKLAVNPNFFKEMYLKNIDDVTLMIDILSDAKAICNRMGLHSLALDSTLLIALSKETNVNNVIGNETIILAYGDGNITCHLNCGDIVNYNISFSSGAPYYLNYQMDGIRRNSYFEKFKGEVIINTTTFPLEIGPREDSIHSFREVINLKKEDETSYTKMFMVENCKSISLMSDGICSYEKMEENGQITKSNELQLIKEMVSFKANNGPFVKKRINMFNKRIARPEKLRHYDDFSMSSILF